MSPKPVKRKQHIVRWSPLLLAAAFALAGCSGGRTEGADAGAVTAPAPAGIGWFGGYLDVTLPVDPMVQDAARGRHTALLAFVTADPARPCIPSWGGTVGLEEAATQLHLDSRIRLLRDAGNDVAVSFGGQRGQELAVGCPDAGALADAYRAVISRYGLDVVDLDIEGQAAEPTAVKVRAKAIAKLQSERPKDNPLRVWLTLPVTKGGLDSAGKQSVQTMLAAGVELAGVNIMTMNFGPLAEGESMLSASKSAAEGTHEDLRHLYEQAGRAVDGMRIWNSMGLTPMIGDNDVEGNTFLPQDAAALNRFAAEQGIGRLSLWSINRDTACSPSASKDQPKPSSNCSGAEQDPGEFTRLLGSGFTGGSR